MRGDEVHVTLSPVDDGRVRLSGTEARFTARDEASQPADAEALAEVGSNLRDERAADLIAAYADQGDAVVATESMFLCSSAVTCPPEDDRGMWWVVRNRVGHHHNCRV